MITETMTNYVAPRKDQYGPFYKYVMPKALAQTYLDSRPDKDSNPHEYLVKVVNEQFRVWGTCVSVDLD